jgi:Fe-S-cluster containining protein
MPRYSSEVLCANSQAQAGTRSPKTVSKVLQYSCYMRTPALPKGDQKLVQIVDAALADATRRSGSWLVCRPGCVQCCMGVFSISQLDAARLQHGLEQLQKQDPERAKALRSRARVSVGRLSATFPGDATTGVLAEDADAEARFEAFANDEPCPVLDPTSGTCDLYEWRPITCRSFGPPIKSQDGLGVCELCFHGATDEEIAACEMEVDPDDLESKLLEQMEQNHSNPRSRTIVAFAVADASK